MSSLIRSEQSIDTNYSAAETRVGSLTSASSANNGIAQSINATSLSSALINNRVYSVGDVSLGTFVSGALAPSNMIVKTESQDSDSSCTDDDSTSGLDWKDNAKKLRINDGAVDYSMTSPSYSSTDSSNANSSGIHSGSRRSGGSRRNGRDDKLNPEDEERRRVRRERNKVAAAKCRQKRVNQTNDLLEETKVLEDEQSRLQEEIKTFQQQKEELEFLLEAHRVHCGAAIQPGVTTTAQSTTTLPIKSESPYEMQMASSQLVQAAGLRRPNMIPIAAPLTSSAMSELTNVPTSGFFVLGLQSMVNGHTGLTPITGLPASEIVSTPDGSRGTNSSFERSSDAKLTSL